MKKGSLIVLSLLVLFTSCKKGDSNEVKTQKNSRVVVCGKIENPKSSKVAVTFRSDLFSGKDSVLIKDSLGEGGTFCMSFDLEKPMYAKFRNSREYTRVYITPGDSIYLTLNADAFDSTLAYSGSGEKVNNYLAAAMMNNINSRSSMQTIFQMEEDDFSRNMDSLYNAQKEFLYAYGIDNENFVKAEEDNIRYAYGEYLTSYEDNYLYFASKNGKETEGFKLSEKFINTVQSLFSIDSNGLENEGYMDFLEGYVGFSMNRIEDENKYQWDNKSKNYETIIGDKKLEEFLLAKQLYEEIDYEGISESSETAFNGLKTTFGQSRYLDVISESWKKWEHLRKGKPAPTFAYPDQEGNTVALEDLKGKFVYIDVWATWCGPCMQEAPLFQKLSEEFTGQDVVFLGVSVDDEEEDWMGYLIKKKPTSVQVFAQNAWESEIVTKYNIAGIPRFILIDRNGNIISASASRPSGDIKEQLKKLLAGPM